MTTTSTTPHQHGHDQRTPRDTRQIEPRDGADALNAQSRTYTRPVYFCLGLVAGALFCLGYLASQNSHNDAHPSPYPYPVAASTPATPGGPGAGTLEFTGPDNGRRCDTPTSLDGDGRESVMRAGPVKVSIAGLDLGGLDALASPCGDRATARPSSDHDNSNDNDSDKGSGKNKNREDKNTRDRGPSDWPGWGGDDFGPYTPGYGYWPGYGPGYGPWYGPGYGPGWGSGYGPYGYYPGNGGRPDLGMCRVVRPGASRDLPDGGLVCTRIDRPDRPSR